MSIRQSIKTTFGAQPLPLEAWQLTLDRSWPLAAWKQPHKQSHKQRSAAPSTRSHPERNPIGDERRGIGQREQVAGHHQRHRPAAGFALHSGQG